MKRTVLMLGGFGFIGSNLLNFIDNHLIDLYDVIVFDKFKCHHKGLRFNCVKKVYAGSFSDILDVEAIFCENSIDMVIHALGTTVPLTSNNIRFDIESNVIPTIDLLDTMLKYKVFKIIYLSSGGAIYGNNNSSARHDENDVAYPVSSYGIVKLTIEKYLYQYSYLYNLKPIILRISNPYGEYHYNDKQGIVNVAARSAIYSVPFSVWGDGSAKKDYIYIEDFCDILFQLIEVRDNYLLLNIGSGQNISINHLLQDIKTIIPSFTWTYKDKAMTDVQRFELSTTRLLSIVGAYNFTPFSIGLEKTINWLKKSK